MNRLRLPETKGNDQEEAAGRGMSGRSRQGRGDPGVAGVDRQPGTKEYCVAASVACVLPQLRRPFQGPVAANSAATGDKARW